MTKGDIYTKELIQRIIDEGLVNKKFVKEHVNNYDLLNNKFKRIAVTKMLKRTGLTSEQFETFWQMYKENERFENVY